MIRSALLAVLVLPLFAGAAAAQDVELLGERYGTPLPEAYRELRARDPGAFRFARGRALRGGQALDGQARDGSLGFAPLARAPLGPMEGPVVGDFHFPVLLGLFADTNGDGPFPAGTVENTYFGDGPGTISAYYDEVSRGKLDLRGEVEGWIRAAPQRTQDWVTDGNSGLGFDGRVGTFIKDLLDGAEGIDWSLYDNDGPDGVPDSGDDDGFVDALAVLHPTSGGECGGPGSGDRVWSHRWSLSASTGRFYTTDVPAAGGGFIKVDDYLIQPVYSCSSGLNEIGVFTHELGHALGLPDLYDTVGGDGQNHQGAGTWDLMATGSWGCDDRSPELPCHMGAWSKLMLGWVDVVDVPAGTGLQRVVLPPVASTGTVYRVASADGSGEYFLLENRQRTGFDASLHEEGLLVWQIDPDWVADRWATNSVNGSLHRGVWLRQADGFDNLGRTGQGRGDAGDPFPFVTPSRENRVFHASSSPASVSYPGSATGVTLLGITRQGDDVSFDLLSRRFSVTVRTEAGGPAGVFSVNGVSVPGASYAFSSAPFQRNEIVADAGEILEPGRRRPFELWLDDPDAPRVRVLETPLEDRTLVARYRGEELELAVDARGGVNGVAPAEFVSVPYSEDLWFPAGTEVSLEARPTRGFAFQGWTGALAGQPNPAAVTVDRPLQAGADFEVVYTAVSAAVDLEAAVDRQVALEVENGTNPVRWTILEGPLPTGLRLDPVGLISGAPMETGRFTVQLEARDGRGLTATADIVLDVQEPALGLDVLTEPFLLVGPKLSGAQIRFLDLRGNGNGSYDLGDLRAWVLAHPGLPLTAPARALVSDPLVLTVPAPPGGGAP